MSILIKGMEMPKNCLSCPLQGGTADCRLTQKTYNWGLTERPSDCPLAPIPPHGRLIDADALIEEVAKMVPWAIADPTANAFLEGLSAAYEAFRAAPTIIEAELPVHHGTFAAASEKEALERIIPAEEGDG